jgi:hypothetical protein
VRQKEEVLTYVTAKLSTQGPPDLRILIQLRRSLVLLWLDMEAIPGVLAYIRVADLRGEDGLGVEKA